MSRQFATSVELTSYYDVEHVKIYIIDRFLFVEAEKKQGLKGVNYTTHRYKHCRRLRRSLEIDKLKAFYADNYLRFTINQDKKPHETELPIDKRKAWKPKPPPPPVVDKSLEGNYDRFMFALREIGMIE